MERQKYLKKSLEEKCPYCDKKEINGFELNQIITYEELDFNKGELLQEYYCNECKQKYKLRFVLIEITEL